MRAFIRRLLLGPDPVSSAPAAELHELSATLTSRIGQLEDLVASLRVEVAETRMQIEAANRRQSVALSLYEHRVDQIYRRVIEEFGSGRGEERMLTLSEEAADAKLMALLSAGLETQVDLNNLQLRDMVSQTLSPGTFKGALTLQGFRLNRAIARERGNAVHVAPSGGDIAIFGPYRRLAPGAYRASMGFELEGSELPSRHAGGLSLDIFSLARNEVVAEAHVEFGLLPTGQTSPFSLAVAFEWGATEAAGLIEIRLHQRSTAAIRVQAIQLDRLASVTG